MLKEEQEDLRDLQMIVAALMKVNADSHKINQISPDNTNQQQ